MSRLRYTTAGESHGLALLAVLEGLPAGLKLSPADIDRDLKRRQLGYGRGGRMKIESDRVSILSGVRLGRTMGSPVALLISNRDFENWSEVMAVEAPTGDVVIARETKPRPGHGDLAGMLKFGTDDARDILERASARETAARVAVGALARVLLERVGVRVISRVVAVGGARETGAAREATEELFSRADFDPMRCSDPEASARMMEEVDGAAADGDTLGGVFEVAAFGVVPGLGSHTQRDLRLDGRLAAALSSIPAIKGVEVGQGFSLAGLRGSRAHDEIFLDEDGRVTRRTNRAGGLEAGMTNGEPLLLRAAMKPIPTLARPLATVDVETLEPARAFKERADVCAVPAAAVVGEAAVALVLGDALLEKFGGDSIVELTRNFEGYLGQIAGIWKRRS